VHHLIHDQWILPGQDPNLVYRLSLYPQVFDLIKIKNLQPQYIPFDQISHKTFNMIDKDSDRFKQADITVPGVVVINMANPHNRLYRMIDGNHRLMKQMEQGLTGGNFFVLQYDDISRFIYPVGNFI